MTSELETVRGCDQEPEMDALGERATCVQVAKNAPFFPFGKGSWQAAEQYRIIRTKLIQHPRQPRLVAISSAGPGDGKTVTAVNLAGALALRSEGRVLLVDVDFRRGNLPKLLGAPRSPGLADLLRESNSFADSVTRLHPLPNLYFLPGGAETDSPAELLDSSRWSALCNCLRRAFDYIVLDTPPVGIVADYDLIQAACDGVVLVVRPDHTNRSLLLKALEVVPPEKLVGVVVNCVEDFFLQKTYGYHYCYDYYGSKSEASAP